MKSSDNKRQDRRWGIEGAVACRIIEDSEDLKVNCDILARQHCNSIELLSLIIKWTSFKRISQQKPEAVAVDKVCYKKAAEVHFKFLQILC